MKNLSFIKPLGFILATFAVLTGCTESIVDDEGADNARLFTVEASAQLPGDDDTRVIVGGYDAADKKYTLTWEGSEKLAVLNSDESYGSASAAPQASISECSGNTATFKVNLPPDEGYTYYAVSPYSAFESSEEDILWLQFPTVQTPTDTSADPAAIMMITEGSQIDGGKLDFRFRHIASYAKMKIKGLDVGKIKSIKFEVAGEEISGAYGYFPSESDGLAETGAVNYVTVNGTNLTADSDGSYTVWFSVIPFELNGKFTVTVTDSAGKTYSKECDATAKPMTFAAGHTISFSVDMTPAPNTYVVLAKYSNNYYALSSKANGARLSAVSLSDYKGQECYETSKTDIVWTITDNGNGTYYLENGGKYLYHDNKNKSTASVSTSKTAFKINFTTGQIVLNTWYLTYNANNTGLFFAFYASNSSAEMVQNLLLVPANGNTGGNGGDDNNGDNNGEGDEKDPDEGGGEDVDPSLVYRTGWPELPVTDEYVYQTNYRRDNKNTDYYYAHHLCPDVNNAQNNGKARNYTVCFSAKHHCPLWVAAPRHKMYEAGYGRSESYQADPNIPSNLQYTSTSTGTSGCNKGHMLGSAERTVTTGTNAQVFYYSNIAPQDGTTFNTGGGAWNNLEDWVDGKVCQDTTYVVIGAYFDNYTDKLRGYNATAKKISYCGRTDVSWPTMFYYVLLRTKNGNTGKSVKECSKDEIICAAFVRSHNCAKGTKVSRQDMMSVAELEAITGFTYFPNVPNAPKDSFNASDWGL